MSIAAKALPASVDVEDIARQLEIERLMLEHWRRVDRVADRPVAELFCNDGEMHIAQLVSLGRDDIESYYRGRRAQEDAAGRKTRHVISNMVCDAPVDGVVHVGFLASVYSGVGDFPLPSNPPSTIADFEALCRVEDGTWRIANMRAAVVFIGGGAPAFAQKD